MTKKKRHAQKPYKLEAFGRQRFAFVGVALLFLASVLVFRLSSLQVVSGVEHGSEFLIEQGERRQIRKEKTSASRGMILDRNGEPLAVSTQVYSITADPHVVLKYFPLDAKQEWSAEDRLRWEKLADSLGFSEQELDNYFLARKNKRYALIKRQLSPEAGQRILDIKVKGIMSEKENRRFYPSGEVTSHVVGITNIADQGQEGLELAYNTWLKGKDGAKQVIRDLSGRVIRDVRALNRTEPGHDLVSSIDLRLQYLAYRSLKSAVAQHNAQAASVVVLNAKTGEVLAVANQPAVNPNDRSNIDPHKLRNRAITDVFEPGSTVKPFTMMAALESGIFTPGTFIDTSPGWIQVGDKTLKDSKDYGGLTVSQVLQKSSQVGTTKIALSLKNKKLWDVFHRAGLGQATESEFPGERTGILPGHRAWKKIDKAAFSFGHGLTVTTLQLARAYSVFANEGKLVDVSFIKREEPEYLKKAFAEDDVNAVLKMMRKVPLEGGTGVNARVTGYSVAGKTGTAHKPKNKGYAKNEYISSFVGLAPSKDPEVIIAVVVDNPRNGKYYGGDVAAPVFSEVATSAMRILNVRPDDPYAFSRVATR